MEAPLKQRLIGAVVLAALALIFVPMLLKSPDVKDPDSADVSLRIPDEPDADGIKTIDIALDGPAKRQEAPPAGVPAMEAAVPPVETPAEPALADAGASVAAGQFALIIPAADDAAAQAIVKSLKQSGLSGAIQSNGSRFRIRIGPYDSRELAEQARLRSTAVVSGGTVVAMDAVAVPVSVPESAKPVAPAGTVAAVAAAPEIKTAPEAPKTAGPKPAAADGKGFAVQIGAPASEQAAIGLRDKARAAGFNSFIQPVETETGHRYRVRIGPEHTRDAARALLASVRQKTGIDGIVVQHP